MADENRIDNYTSNTQVSAPGYGYWINNYGNHVTIYGGWGDASIYNQSDGATYALIYGTRAEDLIRNYSEHTTIYGSAGKDTIENRQLMDI